MPSSNKTLHLQLNKWLGSDKPKKDDFNGDNQKIDEACRLLEQSIGLLESTVQGNYKANEQALSSLSASLSASISSVNSTLSNSISSVNSTLSSSISSQSSTLSAHTGNSGIHVTQSEKDAWSNNSGAILGSYQGNGNATQKITLGFSPLFVFIFPTDDGLTRINWTGQMLAMNSGCVTKLGSSLGMVLNSDGFTVEHQSVGGFDGFQIKYNASGVKYIYLAFKQ